MKKITLLAAFFVAFAMNAQVTIWEDGFESYDDFAIENIGGYTQIDNDASPTYNSNDYDFTNEGYTGTGIVWNATMTDPPATGTVGDVRTGDKGIYFIAATSLLNDDYFITPVIDLSGATGSTFSLWAKSITDQYGPERFEILLSNTGVNQGDFTVNLSGGEELAPIDYTEYSYDISAYDGQQVYIALHYVAQDSFILQTDDWLVQAVALGVADQNFNNFNYFVDANNQLNLMASTAMSNVQLYNVLGQQVFSQKLANSSEVVNLSSLKSGVYFATITIDNASKTVKIIKK